MPSGCVFPNFKGSEIRSALFGRAPDAPRAARPSERFRKIVDCRHSAFLSRALNRYPKGAGHSHAALILYTG